MLKILKIFCCTEKVEKSSEQQQQEEEEQEEMSWWSCCFDGLNIWMKNNHNIDNIEIIENIEK